MNEFIIYKAVYRTAPATPGLLSTMGIIEEVQIIVCSSSSSSLLI